MTLKEHQKIDLADLDGFDLDTLRRRVNYDTSRFIASKINLIRYEFKPSDNPKEFHDGFYSYFRIGAEWLDTEQTRPVVVVPKMENIDFISMFMTCLQTSETADGFSSIYDIDFDAKPIKSKALSSVLSPLLVVQFLMTVKRISAKGLRRGYVAREENLNKVKGRIDIRRNERRNVLMGHNERIYCKFDEFSENTPENRLLKKALTVSYKMISKMSDHSSYSTISAMCNHCLSAFTNVDDEYVDTLPQMKNNKLYQDYTDAIRFALMILRRQDIAISGGRFMSDIVPVFRMDMALLFEHYTLAKLRHHFGENHVSYQVKSINQRFIADFLIHKNEFRAIVDTKYVDGNVSIVAKPEYIKQLCAYARDTVFLKKLGYDVTDEQKIPIVPCVILYPTEKNIPMKESMFFTTAVRSTVKFYTMPVTIPTYNN